MTQESVHKITLSSGKVVYLREFKIKHQEIALRSVGRVAGDNQALLGVLVQKEIVKQLVCRIDDRDVTYKDLEDLDSNLRYAEFQQVNMYIAKMMGADESGEIASPNFELVSFGSK